MKVQLDILHLFQAIATLAGFMHWKKIKDSYFKWFPPYLLIILLAEYTGRYFKVTGMLKTNFIFFNYAIIPFEFLFFFWLFHMSFILQKYNRLPVICLLVYIASIIPDWIYFHNKTYWFYSFSYTVGNLLLLILIFRFFFNLILSSSILFYRQSMLFWISTGLLLFYLGTFPYFGLRNTLMAERKILIAYTSLVNILNCLMYLMFTISFIWGKPSKYEPSSS